MNYFAKCLFTLAGLCLLLTLAGCGDGSGLLGGFGLGTPPGSGTGTLGGVSGRVVDGEGNPIAGASVYSTDGVTVWEDVTDENGQYSLASIAPGARVVSFAMAGFTTTYDVTVIGSAGVTLNVTLDTYEGPAIEAAPVITLNPFEPNADSGIGVLSGTVTGLDSDRIIVTINGSDSLITVNPDGSFSTTVVLVPGENALFARARNAIGVTTTDPLLPTFTPSGDLFFRVTLTWDGEGDIDLHTWDPNMAHSSYVDDIIPTGNLDVDNTDADGPENFTCTALEQGRYRIGVDSYSAPAGRKATIRVTVGSGPNAGKFYTFGPYTFTESDGNDNYPVVGNTASWWRPCDIVVNGSTISAVAPDGTELQYAQPGVEESTARRARIK